MKISDIESKEFNLKFSFEKLVSNLMYLQKILEMYPDKNSHPHKDCLDLWDTISDQLSDDERDSINNYFTAIRLDNSLEDGNESIN